MSWAPRIFAAALLALALAAPGFAAEPVKVGLLSPLSGNSASAGNSGKAAVELAVEIVNGAHRGVKFDETGQNTEAATYLIQLQGGAYKAVWPDRSATAQLQWPMKGWK
jgi:hypothetical protein